MKSAVCLVAALALFVAFSEAKVFTRCGLAKELLKQGFPKTKLDHWVCLVEAESSRSTSAVGPPNSNGSRDYGLFQINDRYWCKKGVAGGDCKVKCEDLLTDNITKASKCAKMIFKRHGFTAWYGWQAKCQKTRPSVAGCFK